MALDSEPSPESRPSWVGLISADAAFRNQLQDALEASSAPFQLALAIDSPFSAIGDMEMQEMERSNLELLVVDLESDPAMGMDFIRSAMKSGVAPRVLAAGRDLSQDLLLQALQAGVMEVLPKPVQSAEVDAALQRILRKAGRTPASDAAEDEDEAVPGRTIAFFGAKGGVGTTSLATNLAVEIHRITGARTRLLDLDVEQGETGILLGLDPNFSLLELLRNYEPMVSGLLASCIDHDEASGIDLLAAPVKSGPVPADDFDLISGERMAEVLAFLREHYDYVVIDRPRTFHPAFDRILEMVDEVYFITTPDLQALRNITRSLPRLERMAGSSKERRLHLVLNRYPANHPISIREIEQTVGLEIYHTLGADFFPLNESIHERTPAVLREKSQYATDVKKLATKITGTAEEQDSEKGFLGGLMDAVRKRG